jgi:hypothetical protein
MKKLGSVAKLVGPAVIAAGAVAAVLNFGSLDQHSAAATSSPAQRPSAVAATPRGSLAELLANAIRSPLAGDAPAQPFAPPPREAAPAAPVPGAAATAPPFPFKYAGWLGEGAARRLVLERGSMVIPVKAGDVLEGFRIDAIHDERLDVTFLAARQQLSLLFASLTTASASSVNASSSGALDVAPGAQAVQFASAGAPASATSTLGASSPGGFVPGPGAAASNATARSASLAQAISTGTDAPVVGSMPTGAPSGLAMQIGATPSGVFPTGPTPRGRLGFEPASSRSLGNDVLPNGTLGQ